MYLQYMYCHFDFLQIYIERLNVITNGMLFKSLPEACWLDFGDIVPNVCQQFSRTKITLSVTYRSFAEGGGEGEGGTFLAR